MRDSHTASASVRACDFPGLLPSVLLDHPADQARTRRTLRDWLVDTGCFLCAVGFGIAESSTLLEDQSVSDRVLVADQIAGAIGCTALWLRRRWPVGVALFLLVLSTFSMLVPGAVLIALFTVTVHRPFPVAATIGGLSLVSTVVYPTLRPSPELAFGWAVLLGGALMIMVLGWGMFVRARRQLILSLRERARRAEHDARLHAEKAQHRARTQIAREMHDVLGHRLSLLSLHAGVLEYRSDTAPEEVERVAGLIRESAHQALQDLREVIGVLRGPSPEHDTVPGADELRPRRTMSDVPELVAKHRDGGMPVEFTDRFDSATAVPGNTSSGVYWIVQEALINARKHAPGAEVSVSVQGGGAAGLSVVIRNGPAPARQRPSQIPGAGMGLIGLSERANLLGGRLDHGPVPAGGFQVCGWLPCEP